MGPAWGVVSGWSLVIAYLVTGCAVLCGAANYVGVLSQTLLGVNPVIQLDVAVCLVVAFGAWYLAYRDEELSTRFMPILEGPAVGVDRLHAAAFYGRTGRASDQHQFAAAGLT